MAKEWGDGPGNPKWGGAEVWGQVPALSQPRGVDAVPTDVLETEDALQVRVDLPGVRPDSVEVILDQDLLTIRGHRREPPPDARLVHRLGRNHGIRKTSVLLPFPVDLEAMRIEADGGVVTVTLPKLCPGSGDGIGLS